MDLNTFASMMTDKERLDVCETCSNRKFDPAQGIICGLTNRKPVFELTCDDYISDPKALVKHGPMIPEYEVSIADKKKSGRDILFGSLWLVGGLVVTIMTYSSASEGGGRYVVAYGAILAGAFQLIRGLMNSR